MWKFRATIRQQGCHDFVAEVMANDQIQARTILKNLYGQNSIVGNNVYRVQNAISNGIIDTPTKEDYYV